MYSQALNVKKKILPLSSLWFLVPSTYAYVYNHLLASYILVSLTGTSVLFHSYAHPITFWMDQLAIYVTVTSSFLYGYHGGFWVFLIPTTGNLWNTYVYWRGYKTKTMCFHPDFFISELWHSTIHFISAISYLALLCVTSQPPRLLESSPG
jgi:hypothetical protein